MEAEQVPFIPPTKVWFPDEDIDTLQATFADILRSGQLTLGKHTAEFERAFAGFLGMPFAVAVNSGTSALEIILRALKLKDEEIVVPTNTFAATAFAVLHSGNRLVLSDIGADLCMSREALEEAISPRTKAVVLVHIGGSTARDTRGIAQFCQERGLILIEDSAHAHGSSLDGRPAGSFGRAAAFSFYPTKLMTSGEGGMIVSADSDLVSRARILRDQGKADFTTNLHVEVGYNWRLSEIHAAIGLAQLHRLPDFLARRRCIAAFYDSLLRGSDLQPLFPATGVLPNYYKYVALLPASTDRAWFKATLRKEHGVALGGEVYEVPLHRQPVFESYGRGRQFRLADDLCARHVCLPISAVMTEAEARRVVSACQEVLGWS